MTTRRRSALARESFTFQLLISRHMLPFLIGCSACCPLSGAFRLVLSDSSAFSLAGRLTRLWYPFSGLRLLHPVIYREVFYLSECRLVTGCPVTTIQCRYNLRWGFLTLLALSPRLSPHNFGGLLFYDFSGYAVPCSTLPVTARVEALFPVGSSL
jgi:hypothetical protein